MTEEGKSRGFVGGDHQQQQQQYGTFQGVPSYPQPQPQPVMGFPQPVPPPGVGSPYPSAPPYYTHGYQAVPGYAVAEVSRLQREAWSHCLYHCGRKHDKCIVVGSSSEEEAIEACKST